MTTEYSPSTLERAPQRAFDLLIGLNEKRIRDKARKNGLTSALISAGRERLLAVAAAPDAADGIGTASPTVAEVASWDERHFSVLEAAIAYYAADVAQWVFNGVSASSDQTESFQAVTTVITRLDRVLAGDKGAPQAPAALSGGLEDLGYGQAERQRIRGLVAQAVSPEQLDTDEDIDGEEDELVADAARTEALVQLKRWHDLAAAICRKAGMNRRQLIRLGLASRKAAKAQTEAPENGGQTVPTPA